MNLSSEDISRIQQVYDLIKAQPERKHDQNTLSRLAGMGHTKLHESFKFLYQISIARFKLEHSMRKAKAMLADGRMIKEVSVALGYNTVANFSRAFFKCFGERPADYRARKYRG
ncbi:helix-turn-helix domain-containing protein [Chitinophaga horti]|uniref:helix-turn-helix domain-containing protein n=1 Tax=Chitinophaga horti TaxID=2920382 RepID=UPI003D8160EC